MIVCFAISCAIYDRKNGLGENARSSERCTASRKTYKNNNEYDTQTEQHTALQRHFSLHLLKKYMRLFERGNIGLFELWEREVLRGPCNQDRLYSTGAPVSSCDGA